LQHLLSRIHRNSKFARIATNQRSFCSRRIRKSQLTSSNRRFWFLVIRGSAGCQLSLQAAVGLPVTQSISFGWLHCGVGQCHTSDLWGNRCRCFDDCWSSCYIHWVWIAESEASSFPVVDPGSLVEPEETKNQDEFNMAITFLNPDTVTQIGDLYADLVDDREE
jgi:hypothetical protein